MPKEPLRDSPLRDGRARRPQVTLAVVALTGLQLLLRHLADEGQISPRAVEEIWDALDAMLADLGADSDEFTAYLRGKLEQRFASTKVAAREQRK